MNQYARSAQETCNTSLSSENHFLVELLHQIVNCLVKLQASAAVRTLSGVH